MPPLTPPKPFRTYSDLVGILTARGMQIKDIPRAERKLAQLGYYRLSGYWYPARQFQLDAQQQRLRCAITKKPLRLDVFEAT
nr:Abi family protein [Vibrio cholerae]